MKRHCLLCGLTTAPRVWHIAGMVGVGGARLTRAPDTCRNLKASTVGSKRRKRGTTHEPADGLAACARKTVAAAAPASVAATAALALWAQLPSIGVLDRSSVNLYISQQLAAYLTSSATLLMGPRAEALAAHGNAAFGEASLRQYEKVATMCAGLTAAWRAAAVAQQSWATRTAASASAADAWAPTAAAWTILPFSLADEPAEGVLGQMRDLLATGERARAGVVALMVAEASSAGGQLALDTTFMDVNREFGQALQAGLAFVHAALLLLAQLRVSAPLDDYAAAGESLVKEAARYAASVQTAYMRRAEWTARALRAGVSAQRHLNPQGLAFYQQETAKLHTLGQAAAGSDAVGAAGALL